MSPDARDGADLAADLAAGAAALALPLGAPAVLRLARFGALLKHWTSRINLVSARAGARDLVERHLLDSLALLRLVTLGGDIVDVGAGGGFPGLPLWLAATAEGAPPSGTTLRLVEPNGKRAAFLRTVVREFALGGVSVATDRVEPGAPGGSPAYDLALSRATFAPAEWVTRAAGLLRPGGRVVVMLAQAGDEAVAAAAAARGLVREREDRFALPWCSAERHNLVFQRPIP